MQQRHERNQPAGPFVETMARYYVPWLPQGCGESEWRCKADGDEEAGWPPGFNVVPRVFGGWKIGICSLCSLSSLPGRAGSVRAEKVRDGLGTRQPNESGQAAVHRNTSPILERPRFPSPLAVRETLASLLFRLAE